MNEIYTVKEVAALLKVSERTVKREIKAGKLRVFYVGRSPRFTSDAIEEYQKNQESVVKC
jgi:excisionase family DNA binding protein